MGIQDHLTCLVRNPYAGQEATVRTGHETTNLFQIGKGHPSSCNAEDITLKAESKEELKSLLMTMKEESQKADLKLNIQKTKIMASGPITWMGK